VKCRSISHWFPFQGSYKPTVSIPHQRHGRSDLVDNGVHCTLIHKPPKLVRSKPNCDSKVEEYIESLREEDFENPLSNRSISGAAGM